MFSGLTEGEIVVNSTSVGEVGNLMTGTMKNFNINQPKWAGSVGNIGENILPTTIDVIKVFKNIDSGTEK